MKFLFLTDFHGSYKAYKQAFQRASDEGLHVVIGGDCLPKGFKASTPFAKAQREFLNGWLIPKIDKLRQSGYQTWMMFGNDDAMGIADSLTKADTMGILHRMDGKGWLPFGDYHILGMPYVPDYPFGLKDWCCGDMERTPDPKQYSRSVYTDSYHFEPTPQPWSVEIQARLSMRERLALLPDPPDAKKAVFVMHSPPAGGGLDVCGHGEQVGTKAGLLHIQDKQYVLSLHGHIHESPKTSGKWHCRIGNTLAVQPGAMPPREVLVDLEAGVVEHHLYGRVNI